jgi:DNA polymerase-3 subunit epsilon/ATP-dependent DNA helicase DinG
MERIYVALDVEMTGTQAGVDEIIEVAAVKFNAQEVLETFSQLVKPRQALPLKITRLTGISAEMLDDAPRFNQVAPAFVRFIKNYPLIGHSVGMDLAMLRAQGMNFDQPVYDTFDLATLLLPGAAYYRLSSLAEKLGVANTDAHRALNDADMCRQVFLHLLQRLEALDMRELLETNRLMSQTDWSSRELVADIVKQKASAALSKPISVQDASALASRLKPVAVENPLKPTNNSEPLDAATIASFFAPDGVLSRHFATYEQRAQQVQMAQGVTQAFNTSDMLVVEAGTGTGKSMAYLVPAVLFALQRGERVVVSTNTINLQDQLFAKDIPDIQRMLENTQTLAVGNSHAEQPSAEAEAPPLRAALLKGRSNYLCLRRYKTLRRDDQLQPHEARALLKVHFWLPTTTTGDRAELPLVELEQAAWGKMNVTPDTCTGSRCPDFRDCFFFRARKQAEAAHIVVVNHALLLADLVSESNVLPQYDHLVLDEAHNLEEVATEQFSFRLDQVTLLQFLDSLFQSGGAQTVSGLLSEYQVSFRESAATQAERDKADQIAEAIRPPVERARQATYDFFNHVQAFVGEEVSSRSSYDTRLRLTRGVRQKPEWATLATAWENLNLALTQIGDGLGKFETLLLELEHADLLDYDELRLRVEWLKRTCTDIRVQTGYIIAGNDEMICWIALDQMRNTLTLNAAPLDVSELLRTQLFAEKQTSVLTSATLSINETFEFIKNRLGLYEPEEMYLDSPFDYQQQALVFIPDDIPDPNQPGYQQSVEDTLLSLGIATGGRTLALFTASNALRQTHARIQEELEDHNITVLGQGIDGTRRALLEQFKAWPRTVLLGTNSFWEGIDVVGDALSVLVIAKLPFQVPSDPIFAARSELFREPFMEYAVPQSILRFKQGFGRLIRSKEDRGIVVILDKRLISKRYGQQFLQSLPATTVRRGTLKQLPALAVRFVGNGTANESR